MKHDDVKQYCQVDNGMVDNGILPGGSIAAQIFNFSFWHTLRHWTEELKDINPELNTISLIDNDVDLYLGLSMFVDDLASKSISTATRGSGEQGWERRERASSSLTAALLTAEAARTLDKEATVVAKLGGQGYFLETKHNRSKDAVRAARYLGPLINDSSNFNDERTQKSQEIHCTDHATTAELRQNAASARALFGECLVVLAWIDKRGATVRACVHISTLACSA